MDAVRSQVEQREFKVKNHKIWEVPGWKHGSSRDKPVEARIDYKAFPVPNEAV